MIINDDEQKVIHYILSLPNMGWTTDDAESGMIALKLKKRITEEQKAKIEQAQSLTSDIEE